MATKTVRRRRLRELEDALRAAVLDLQWMAEVWNAADRVAGRPGELPYDPSAPPEPPPPSGEPVAWADA